MLTAQLGDAVSLAVDAQGNLTPALRELGRMHGWKHNNTLPSFVQVTQETCMPRDEATGRRLKAWEILPNEDEKIPRALWQPTHDLLNLLGQNGDKDAKPGLAHYRYLFIHGQWPPEAWMRTQLVREFWLQNGTRFDEIVVLASQLRVPGSLSVANMLSSRVINPALINPFDPENLPQTEVTSIDWMLKALAPPGMLEDIKLALVETPDVIVDGLAVPADTRDSLRAWRKIGGASGLWSPKNAGDVLAISNGWQTPRQRIITLTELLSWGCNFDLHTVETIGAPGGYPQLLTVRLREFAAWLWEVNCILTAAA